MFCNIYVVINKIRDMEKIDPAATKKVPNGTATLPKMGARRTFGPWVLIFFSPYSLVVVGI
jgi:hypothetical protein